MDADRVTTQVQEAGVATVIRSSVAELREVAANLGLDEGELYVSGVVRLSSQAPLPEPGRARLCCTTFEGQEHWDNCPHGKL